jgi:hypothetical protein
MGIRYAEGLKVLPILAPVADSTSVATSYVDLDTAQWASFLVQFGAMTSDSTDTVTITVECSTESDSNATEIQVPFKYRLSAAVDTDTMGAITSAAAATGAVVTAADDNKLLIVDVDPASLPSLTGYTDHRFLRLVLTKSAGLATNIIDVIAVLEPRYPGNAIPSSI